jgi:heme exporter protein C
MTLILWTIFAAYLVLRVVGRDEPEVARYAAVLALVGVLDIPLIMFSVRLWRGMHPSVISAPRGQGGLQDPRMTTTLLVTLAAFLLLFLWLLWRRYESLRVGDEMRHLEQRLAEAYR